MKAGMVRCTVAGWMLAALAGSSLAESYMVVRITDMKKVQEYQSMSSTEFKELQKAIALETKVFPKAEELAVKDWKADELNKGIPFPGSALSPRKAEIKFPFPKQEDAEKKLEDIKDKESAKEDREMKKAAEKAKTAGTTEDPKKVAAREEKANAIDRGSEVLQAKLDELVAKEKEKLSGVKPAEGGEGKADEKKPAEKEKKEKEEKGQKDKDPVEAGKKAL